jgi:hypothetical protein
MKSKIYCLLMFLFLMMSRAYGAPAPFTTSPADGSADTWYYIEFSQRDWPVGSGNRYLYDQGANKPLIATPALPEAALGGMWKIELTDVAGEYRIVSKNGNGIEYTAAAIASTSIVGDRYYAGATSTARYKIEIVNTNYYMLTRVGGSGIDKSNIDNQFDAYSGDAGVSITFKTATEVTPTTAKALSALSLPTSQIDFGKVTVGLASQPKTFILFGYNLTGNVAYSLSGTNAGAFTVDPTSPIVPNSDGVVAVTMSITLQAPTTPATLSATMAVTNSETNPLSISLTGVGEDTELPMAISPSIGNTENDHWYYLYFNARTNFVMQAVQNSENLNVLEARPLLVDEPEQLWKVVSTGISGKYIMVNKTGKQIAYKIDLGTGNSANLFYSTDNSSNTFDFYKRTDTYWQLKCNESSYVNKTNGNLYFTYYNNTADAGNSIQFIAQENLATTNPAPPIMPTPSTYENEHWYQIKFNADLPANDRAFQDQGPETNISLTATAEETVQYWKFTGTWDNYKIETYSGGELAAVGSGDDSRFQAVANSGGDHFKFEYASSFWRLSDSDKYGASTTQRYVNRRSPAVGFYTQTDPGCALVFFPVTTSIPAEFTVDETSLDLGSAPINTPEAAATGAVAVAARNLPAAISYTITADGSNDAAAFSVVIPETGWSAKRGGNLPVSFAPTEVKTYHATLEITANGVTKQVALTGSGSSDPILTVTPLALSFGATTAGLVSEPKTATVAIAYGTHDVTYERTGADASAFEIDATSFVPATGGTLSVTFKPTQAKAYEAALVISSEGAITKTVTLTGTGEVTELPVTLSTAGNEAWYYITFDKRAGSGNAVQATGEGKMLEIRPAIEAEDAQWWKVVSTGVSGKYQIISKSGKQLAYTATATGDILADRFYTAETTTYTYGFTKHTDGAWQIRCNEENSYINKANLGSRLENPYFGKYQVLGDVGSSVVFVPEADMAYPLPQFSTDTENHWYRVQYLRQSSKVVTDAGEGANLTQTTLAEGNLSQYWKLVGTWESFKLVSLNGLEMNYNTTAAKYQAVAAGTGGSYKLAWCNNVYDAWRIYDPSVPAIVNDQAGATVTSYFEAAGDGGNALQFLPVTPIDFVINAGETKSATDYRTDVYSDIVFKSTDASTGQLTGIGTNGVEVSGVVKVVKTLTPAAKYALGFPFAIAGVSSSDYTLQSYNGTTNLYEPAIAFEPNKGYLLTFTGAAEGEITFSSTGNPVLKNTTAPAPALAQAYTLVANPSVANVAAIDGATRYYAYGTNGFTLLEQTATLTLKPFEAVIAVKGVTDFYPEIGNGIRDGLSAIDAIDPVILVKYYNLQGVEVRQPVEGNVYLLKKLHASQRIEVVKEFKIKK